jgi:hypothetical protein
VGVRVGRAGQRTTIYKAENCLGRLSLAFFLDVA